MLPPAPARLSTTMVWPHVSVSFCATRRATMSVAPPGANGTMIRTGRQRIGLGGKRGSGGEHACRGNQVLLCSSFSPHGLVLSDTSGFRLGSRYPTGHGAASRNPRRYGPKVPAHPRPACAVPGHLFPHGPVCRPLGDIDQFVGIAVEVVELVELAVARRGSPSGCTCSGRCAPPCRSCRPARASRSRPSTRRGTTCASRRACPASSGSSERPWICAPGLPPASSISVGAMSWQMTRSRTRDPGLRRAARIAHARTASGCLPRRRSAARGRAPCSPKK